MTASLVTLFRPREGWSNEERAQFARIERLLEDAGFAVDVEHGLSDEGEPWCVFCSRATGDVVIHVACIDNRFMFDSTTLPRPIEGASFQRCAERFFEDVTLPMPLVERRDRVLLHPSAMLASLFITVLLYAQATTEQPLFDVSPIDVDQDDPDSALSPTPLALRIKLIAQQVSEFVNGSDTQAQQQAGQAYVNPGMAAIPAGMALAVIAIAQDLANAEQAGLINVDEEPTIAALLRAVAAEQEVVAPVNEEPAALAEGDGGERTFGDTAEQANATTEGEAGAETYDLAEAIGAALNSFTAEILDASAPAGSVLAYISGGFDAIDRIDRLAEVEIADLFQEAEDAIGFDAGDGLGAIFAVAVEITGLEQTSQVAFELAGRVWEIEVVDLAAGALREIELAMFSPDHTDSFDLAVLDDDPTVTTVDGAARRNGETVDSPSYDAKAGLDTDTAAASRNPSERGFELDGGLQRDPAIAMRDGTPPRENDVAAILAEDRFVTESELDLLLASFSSQVGEFGVAPGPESLMFVDMSVTEHVQSRDLHATTVWLEDETRVTFVGTIWDFDGFLA
ncbi:MAG: hypothetical protein AAFU49_04080 [Pseudomonadota bacterium]